MTPARFEALDAWRGICALVVAVEHLAVAHALHANAFVKHGARFVDFFFVLSGFVIAHAYRDRLARGASEVKAFVIRRLGRLWPLHAAMIGVLVLAELALLAGEAAGLSIGRAPFSDRNTLHELPHNLALVHSWGMLDQLTWNTPSWSISTEVFAYGLFAAIAALLARWLPAVMMLVLVGAAAVVAFVAPLGMASTQDFGLFRCIFGFATGVLVRLAWEHHRPRVGTGGELAVVALVLVAVVGLPRDQLALLVTPVFALAVWVFASEDGAVSRALRGRSPQALGAWSYSLYMVHAPIVFGLLTAGTLATARGYHVLERVDGVLTFVGPPWFTTIVILGYVALVVGVARLTYRFIEMPGQRVFNRWGHRGASR